MRVSVSPRWCLGKEAWALDAFSARRAAPRIGCLVVDDLDGDPETDRHDRKKGIPRTPHQRIPLNLGRHLAAWAVSLPGSYAYAQTHGSPLVLSGHPGPTHIT